MDHFDLLLGAGNLGRFELFQVAYVFLLKVFNRGIVKWIETRSHGC